MLGERAKTTIPVTVSKEKRRHDLDTTPQPNRPSCCRPLPSTTARTAACGVNHATVLACSKSHYYKFAAVNAPALEKLFGTHSDLVPGKSRESLVTSEDDLGDVDLILHDDEI
jgi:hypothetical protein